MFSGRVQVVRSISGKYMEAGSPRKCAYMRWGIIGGNRKGVDHVSRWKNVFHKNLSIIHRDAFVVLGK